MGMDELQPKAAAFASALVDLGDQLEKDAFEKVIKKVLIDLWARIQETTPVDTGRARASWMLDQSFSDWQLPAGEYRAAVSANLSTSIAALPVSDHYCLFNNVEYISYLEDGSSKQAPSGFIAVALAALADNIRSAAASAGYAA